ncbi:MAG: hypothetical protein GX565_12995, partial [Lentisphaerae bacterium]|nr:hypothetical protein [Lentisphaerota bacterium]
MTTTKTDQPSSVGVDVTIDSGGAVTDTRPVFLMNPDRRDKRLSILPDIRFPPELPITAYAAAITSALRDNPTIIVCGDT